jgi:hypothetical protein
MEAICKADFEKRVTAHEEMKKLRDKAEKEKKSTAGIIVPKVGFYDAYGIWFFGGLKEVIMQIEAERFGIDHNNKMHVFVDIEPDNICEGIHDIGVYGHACQLYKWLAQGYHRGLVVLVEDEAGNMDAELYRQSGTWSWNL